MIFSMPPSTFASSPAPQPRHASDEKPCHALPSESLLRGHKTVEIMHNGSLYKLQATKLGKLILTK
jgi:hemin uptake protein HemP